MKLIKEEKFDLRLKGKEFSWSFEIEKEGSYGIEVLASCKSWWQNFLMTFICQLDNLKFYK